MAMAAVAATSAYCGAACSAGRGGRSDGRGVLAMAAAGKLGMHACEGLGVGWGLSRQPQRAATGLGAWDGSEEREGESMIGDYCLLYSPLKEVSPARSKRRVGVGLVAASGRACGRSWQAKAVPDQVTNGAFAEAGAGAARLGRVSRVTKETQVEVEINLDGTGICNCDTGIPFLDHMLDQLASHGLFDLNIQAKGDIHIDDHHSNEDIALALGTALLKALGDRKGIQRFGDFSAPLDEALVHVVLDLSGRPYLGYGVEIPTQRVGTYDTQLVEHFFQSVVNTSGMTLHIRQLAGKNSHHIIEATFKAFARALRQATEFDSRRGSSIPSSKGVLSRA